MSLIGYRESRPWAAAIREAVLLRKMPPWHADSHYGKFLNVAALSETEIQTIDAWARTGAKDGDPKDLPAPPEFTSGWHMKPDAVFSIPDDQVVEPATRDEYEYIYVPTGFKEDKWVQAAEVLPGNRRIVHHAAVSVLAPEDVPSASKSGTQDTDQYRYRVGNTLHIRPEVPVVDDGCASADGGEWPGHKPQPIRVPAIYLPGHLPEVRPNGYALRIPAGSYLEFQIHYSNQTGKVLRDRTSIGFAFVTEPVEHEVAQYEIWNNLFQIPPGDRKHRVTSCYTLQSDVEAIAYTGHMHYRGRSFSTEAVFPDGHHETLFSVPNYDFRWQETYVLKDPRVLPKGTRLIPTAYFDNSPDNPLNPDPSQAVRWGQQTDEEMMGFWLQFASATETAPIASSKR